MSKIPPPQRELIARLDSRHDELISKLDELNAQIELALAEFAPSRAVQCPPSPQDASLRKAA